MVRHSMKILALSAVLSKMLAQKVLCALCWGKSYSGALEDKGEKKFHNPCALFKETLKKKKNKKLSIAENRNLLSCQSPDIYPSASAVLLRLASVAMFCIGTCEERDACCRGEGGVRSGLCVLHHCVPQSVVSERRDGCRLWTQMAAMGLLGQCECWEHSGSCFGVPGLCGWHALVCALGACPGDGHTPDGLKTSIW